VEEGSQEAHRDVTTDTEIWEHAARAFELRAPDPVREQADEASWRTPGTLAKIPAQADHDPEKGETDVLGREPGEFMESARRRTPAHWLKKIREVGSRVWNALYQGRPSPAEGTMFKRDQWREYDVPPWVEHDSGAGPWSATTT
jgi:hypothetical protein